MGLPLPGVADAQLSLVVGANLHNQTWSARKQPASTLAEFLAAPQLRSQWHLMGSVDAVVPLDVNFGPARLIGDNANSVVFRPIATYHSSDIFDLSSSNPATGAFAVDLELESVMAALLSAGQSVTDTTSSAIMVRAIRPCPDCVCAEAVHVLPPYTVGI